MSSALSRRASARLWLFLLAVLIPTAVVIVVGSRSAAQDAELNRRRKEDDRRNAVAGFRERLLVRLDRILAREAVDWVNPIYADSSVVFSGRIDRDRVIPQWELDSATVAFAHDREQPEFAAALTDAQRASVAPIDSAMARRAFDRLRIASTTQSQQDYAALLASHVMPTKARTAELSRLARSPMTHRDEFGVPFALYAASALSREQTDNTHAVIVNVVARAQRELLPARTLSPTACLQFRAIASMIDDPETMRRIVRRCADLEAAERLLGEAIRAEVPTLERKQTVWRYFADADWLVARNATTGGDRLIAVRAAQAVTPDDSAWRIVPLRSKPGAEPLGAEFLNAAVVVPPAVVAVIVQPSRYWLYVAALLVLIALATTSASLLWRDVRREADVAALRADFVSAVSHELKTPLTAIRMYVETLRERPSLPSPTRDEYLHTILAESERLTRLLDNVLDFSRAERDQRTYVMRPEILDDVVVAAVRTMEHAMTQQGFAVDVTIGSTDIAVHADADALRQAILNLLTNAMKYSSNDRRVSISLAQIDDEARLSVMDRGVGIAASEHERVFEKFYRANSSIETGAAGAGLGLTIVRHIIQAHHGRVTVDSEVGRGSVFTIVLPVLRDVVSAPVERNATTDAIRA